MANATRKRAAEINAEDLRKPVFDLAEAAGYLSLGYAAVHRLVKSGRLRSVRLTGRAYRIRREWCDALLEAEGRGGPAAQELPAQVPDADSIGARIAREAYAERRAHKTTVSRREAFRKG